MTTIQVHRNGPLTVLPQFVEKQYGLHWKNINGACLFTQLAYIAAAACKTTPQKIANKINKWAVNNNIYVEPRGWTLEQTINAYEVACGLIVSVEAVNVADVPHMLNCGRPMVMIVSSHERIRTRCARTSDGILPRERVQTSCGRHDSCTCFHTLLVVGYDEMFSHLIVRETRSKYGGIRGYMKVPYDELVAHPAKVAVFLAVNVRQ